MQTERRSISLGFNHLPICEGEHICLIYRDEQERRSIVSKFLQAGLAADEQVLSLVDSTAPEEFADILRTYGVEPSDHEGALSVLGALETYCPSGHFDSEALLESFKAGYAESRASGFAGWRGTGEMSWALRDGATTMKALIDYEVSLNELLVETPVTAFCQYDVRRFDGATLFDVMAVHPKMIVGGQLMNNPMYLEPAAFAAQYRAN